MFFINTNKDFTYSCYMSYYTNQNILYIHTSILELMPEFFVYIKQNIISLINEFNAEIKLSFFFKKQETNDFFSLLKEIESERIMYLFLIINPNATKNQYANILVIASSANEALLIRPQLKNHALWIENPKDLILKNLGKADISYIEKYKTNIVATTFIA